FVYYVTGTPRALPYPCLRKRQGLVRTVRPRIATSATHGTGCTLSAAIAALLARRRAGVVAGTADVPDWMPVVEAARDYLQAALAGGEVLAIGSGHGPVHHFAGTWDV
ncbi:bifunctional hydroxymethylpyrimidine kinase/phosphomethylpyrimidine kinase, partial [Blastococcus atacamensis]|uniref:bifunctional hydroxymethylpyrimidine kinase/phosphomethylpyrimidine kinase n=1 Tax=Blastococcus atacamensis TaxID=2070508 RepID=UPI0018E46443